jgi:hypothetical protein
MQSLEDTQPTIPITEPPEFIRPDEEDAPVSEGPGCATWGLLGVLALGFALVIVLLAALAGWTSGQRTAQANATTTQSAAVNEQLSRLPGDLDSGNLELANARLQFLATLTPGVAGLPDLMQTATALYLTRQPTATPPPTATTSVAPTAEATEQTVAVTQSASGDYDLPALLQEAQAAVSLRDWETAIELLDVIIAADSAYETATVRGLMSDALNTYALELFRSDQLAEAIVVTDRAEQFGPLAEGLNFERLVASNYLTAVASIGISYPAAIEALQQVYSLSPNYRGGEIAQMLFNQYVAYGDALSQQGSFCAAAPQYEAALSIQASGDISGRRDTASTLCATITLTPPALLTPGTPASVAPVGAPGG